MSTSFINSWRRAASRGVSVTTSMPSVTVVAQAGMGRGGPGLTSTTQMRQEPMGFKAGW